MKILYRYVFREHVGPFFFGLSVIMFILVMDFILEVLNMIIGKGLNAFTILQVFVLNLAWMLALAVPMAVLVATLMAFGRLSQDNEITALKASGVSIYRLVLPALTTSVIIAGGMAFFNDRVLPELNHHARLLMTDIHQKRPTWNLKENVFIDDVPGYNILIKKIDPQSSDVRGVTIYDLKRRRMPRTIIAEKGKVEFTPDGNTLIFRLFNGEVHETDEKEPQRYRRVSFDRQTIYIHDVGSRLIRSRSDFRTDREKTSAQMLGDVRKSEAAVTGATQRMREAATLAWEKVTTYRQSEDTLSGETMVLDNLIKENQIVLNEILASKQDIKNKRRLINSLMVEVHKKFALAAACIVFVLVGAPLGVMARKGGMAVGLGLSLGFFVLYWAFLIGGEELADRQLIPAFWAMWSANILIGGAGIYILVKSAKEAKFISWEWTEKFVPKRFRKRPDERKLCKENKT
ncbi:MAG: LptF/LptG family permease [Candidatus Zixiibacteriota bacterium]|nr:MAG: LptF/LptG family permease [candidate division Zixibacteria bacterium]